MATMQGITGKLSGKMGSAVFRVRDGQQVVTQYNPIVKNPNSDAQQAQRAKFKLMSQLAAVMSSGFGTLAVAKRKAKGGQPSQRNAFVELNFGLVETSTAPEGVVAKIPMEQLKLTSSFRNLPSLELSQTSASEGITADIFGIASDVTTIRLVLVAYDQQVGGSKQAVVRSIVDAPVVDGQVSYDLTATAGEYTVLAYGLIPSESAKASIDLDNIHTPADDDFISAVALNAMVAAGTMAETMTRGANITVTAA